MTRVIRTYTEDHLVEQPAIGLFASLRWQPVSAMEEASALGDTLSRYVPNLRRTHNLLLPRLLSGQIEVDIDKPLSIQ